MATAVESPSIASAKERAASILYGNEKPVEPVIAEYNTPVKEEPKTEPKFSSYYHAEPIRTKRPTEYRRYEPVYEPAITQEPRVVRPFLDANEAVATVEVAAPTVTTTSAPVAVTSKTVKSEIDAELEADTQYVVKFKKSTIIAVAAVATVFVLLTVLFIVNIVSLCTVGGELSSLQQEEQQLSQELDQALRDSEAARRQAIANAGSITTTTPHYVVHTPVAEYAPAVTASDNTGFFNWLCQSLSGLFS